MFITPSSHSISVHHDHLLIEPLPEPEVSGSIHLPASTIKEQPTTQGIIRDIAPQATGAWWPGQHIIFSRYSGTAITLGKDSYLILSEKEVLATLTVIPMTAPQEPAPNADPTHNPG